MARPLKIGVVGLGHAHGPMWAEAFRRNPDCELVGIWDHDADRAARVASENGCASDHDLVRFLGQDLDAVALTSEHALHRAHIEAAVSAGLAILCEKPLATTLEDAAAVIDAVGRAGVRFMQGYQMRLDPANLEVRRLVQRGDFGQVSSIVKRHSHYFGIEGWPDDSGAWFFDPAVSGGGAGLDEMVHTCDWLRWIFGEPVSVTAVTSSATLDSPVEDLVVAVYRMASGAIATLLSSWTDLAGAVTTQVAGDRGSFMELYTDLASVRCGRPFDASVLVQCEPERAWTPLEVQHSFPNVHAVVADEFVRCLRTGDPFPSGLEDGRASLAMVLAAYESARSGTVVGLEHLLGTVQP